jgi:hypothetical protein
VRVKRRAQRQGLEMHPHHETEVTSFSYFFNSTSDYFQIGLCVRNEDRYDNSRTMGATRATSMSMPLTYYRFLNADFARNLLNTALHVFFYCG